MKKIDWILLLLFLAAGVSIVSIVEDEVKFRSDQKRAAKRAEQEQMKEVRNRLLDMIEEEAIAGLVNQEPHQAKEWYAELPNRPPVIATSQVVPVCVPVCYPAVAVPYTRRVVVRRR